MRFGTVGGYRREKGVGERLVLQGDGEGGIMDKVAGRMGCFVICYG